MSSSLKGYFTEEGYRGFVPHLNRYMLFADETDYFDYVSDEE